MQGLMTLIRDKVKDIRIKMRILGPYCKCGHLSVWNCTLESWIWKSHLWRHKQVLGLSKNTLKLSVPHLDVRSSQEQREGEYGGILAEQKKSRSNQGQMP